jgi:hypothetical protein
MILEKLVEAIENSEHSRYAIHKATGVDQSVLHRIVNGGSCSIETADQLCNFLDLELIHKKRKRKAAKK